MSIQTITKRVVIALVFVTSSYGDDWDPGDNFSTGATVLSINETVQTHGLHDLDGSDTNDWFAFTLLPGNIYYFESTGTSDTLGFLYSDSAGTNHVASSDDEGAGLNFSITYSTAASNTYYLKVEAYQGGDANYSLNYNCVPSSDSWDPLDDSRAGATTLVPDLMEASHGPHILSPADTNDWFHFSLSAGSTYLFESTGSADTIGFFYDDSGGTNYLDHSDDDGIDSNFRIVFSAITSGDYYLKVISFNNNNASYSLKYSIAVSDEWDPIDNVATGATELVVGDGAKIHGPHTLRVTDTLDWFKLNLSTGVTYRFLTVGDMDTIGTLYSDIEGLNQEAHNDDLSLANLNFQIDYAPATSSVYYLKVNAFTYGGTNYNLKYLIPALDSDEDQMPDAWELLLLGGDADPYGHSDSDTQDNLSEYIAGTDPSNGASFFAATNWMNGGFVIEWLPSVVGREYQVLWAESLTNDFEQIGPVMEHPQNSYTDTAHSAESSGFYKAEVQLK